MRKTAADGQEQNATGSQDLTARSRNQPVAENLALKPFDFTNDLDELNGNYL